MSNMESLLPTPVCLRGSVCPSHGLSLQNYLTVPSRSWAHWLGHLSNQGLVAPWHPGISWVQSKFLLGPVFRFWKLLEKVSAAF